MEDTPAHSSANAGERCETFRIEPDGDLVRAVIPSRGEPYEHRCPKQGFEAVACAAESAKTFVLEGLRAEAGVPWTQAAVAFAFLKARGVVVPARGRRHAAATADAFLDAMIEYHALREKGLEGSGPG